MLQFMGLQSRTQLSLTELNWCDLGPDWFTNFNGSSGSLKYKEQITSFGSLVLIPHRTAVFSFNVFADIDFPYSAQFFPPQLHVQPQKPKALQGDQTSDEEKDFWDPHCLLNKVNKREEVLSKCFYLKQIAAPSKSLLSPLQINSTTGANIIWQDSSNMWTSFFLLAVTGVTLFISSHF